MSTDTTVPYTGPIPSPASGFAPWVMLTGGFAALGNLVQLFFNLVERHLQQMVKVGTPPASSRVLDTLATLKTANLLTFLAAAAYVVAVIAWRRRRRPRARLHQYGEQAVEPRLRTVSPALFVALLSCVLLSLITRQLASSTIHGTVTPAAVVQYRTMRAGMNFFGMLGWTSAIALAWRATTMQDARELAAVSGNDAGRPVVGLDL
ncbi:MAG: hypothetical protein QOI55_2490 [Actinomycetota bacterium]|jgi:cellobiose-specific phosphotransferase system component IIC|nr:hypothetical protein [Actinomycetota bacterium]